LDNASTQFAVAKSQLDSAKDNYAMTKTGPRVELIQAAEAEVNAAEATLDLAESQLSDTVIRAPVDGTILERLIEVGEIVTNTSFGGTRGARTALLSVADLKDIQVEIDINEADIHKVHQDQPASIALEAYPDYSYKGKLVEIAPQANRQKATVQVKVQFLNPDDKVKPEMSAKVSFLNDVSPDLANKKGNIYVPAKAIVTENGESYVFVVTENKVSKVKIKKGKDSEFGTEVEEGLTGNETIVVGGLEHLKDGNRIRIK
jgi:HlyD family secretion protein